MQKFKKILEHKPEFHFITKRTLDMNLYLTNKHMISCQHGYPHYLPSYRVLRRRVVWLIGCWVGVKFSSDLQPLLYNTLLPLLRQEEDLVVRMEAAYTLRIDILYCGTL